MKLRSESLAYESISYTRNEVTQGQCVQRKVEQKASIHPTNLPSTYYASAPTPGATNISERGTSPSAEGRTAGMFSDRDEGKGKRNARRWVTVKKTRRVVMRGG